MASCMHSALSVLVLGRVLRPIASAHNQLWSARADGIFAGNIAQQCTGVEGLQGFISAYKACRALAG